MKTRDEPLGPPMAQVVDRNIQALLERRRCRERSQSLQDRLAEKIGNFAGSMPFVYLHIVLFGIWIGINLGVVPGIKPFDPSFSILAMAASVEAIFLSTFVLITQNRMQVLADVRADLDLQVSLLSEHEVTRLIHLVSAMAERMGVEGAQTSELDELKKDVHPEEVLDRIENASARTT